MLARLSDLPFIVLLIGFSAVAMLFPAVHASAIRDLEVARAFFYSGILFFVLFALLAIATKNYRITRPGRSHLISILAFFIVVPVILAVPFSEAVPDTRFLNAYVEMVSSLTTTGLTLFEPERLPDSVHLWRAFVGWLGGYFVLVTAVAIMAPLNLGGFEVASFAQIGQGAGASTSQITRVANSSERLQRFGLRFAPIYGGLTLVLWIVLILAGDRPFVAVCHAMSTLATSGISPIGGVENAGSGFAGEFLILLFFVFALTRMTFISEDGGEGARSIFRDPELRLGLLLITILPILMFARHWAAAFEEDAVVSLAEGVSGIWGALFTVASFLTTTGFESAAWDEARAWSGLEAPGLLLMGLALFGGGVATTAGGVKLLRVYALYKHGLREMEKLVQPSSIGGAGQVARRLRRQGAYVAWIFFMLFVLSIAAVMIILAATGLDFETALILTIATLTTTGPLVSVVADGAAAAALSTDVAKVTLSAAMVLGRLETLVIIALLNPEFWR